MPQILRLKIALRGVMCDTFPASYCTRTIEVRSERTLEHLAKAILDAYDFYFDHAFGFYDDLKNYHDSAEKYTLFADMEDDIGEEEGQGVRKTKIGKVFAVGKKMLFLFDYGDEWIFHVNCVSVGEPEKGRRYPITVESKGEAPPQYPDYEEDEDDESV